MNARDHSAMFRRSEVTAGLSTDQASRAVRRTVCIGAALLTLMTISSCDHQETRLVLTKPINRDTLVTRVSVAQIHSCQNSQIRAPQRGYLEVHVQEGQRLKAGDLMFKILSQAPNAAVKQVDPAHPGFKTIPAPFDGLMGRLRLGNGSLVKEGDVLTTLSDNSEMWADFNVPEAQSQEYSSMSAEELKQVKLMMANGRMFDQTGRLNPIEPEPEVSKTTGTIPFRAVFPNPKHLLRHGQTGNIRIQHTIKNALLLPRQSTFEIADHHYIYVVDKDHVIHRKQVSITHELGDLFVVAAGVSENDMIVFAGMRQIHDGEKAGNYEFKEPAVAYADLKLEAE